jgi:hypothetical protein
MVRLYRSSHIVWYCVSSKARSSCWMTVAADAVLCMPCWSIGIILFQLGWTHPCSSPSQSHGLSALTSIGSVSLAEGVGICLWRMPLFPYSLRTRTCALRVSWSACTLRIGITLGDCTPEVPRLLSLQCWQESQEQLEPESSEPDVMVVGDIPTIFLYPPTWKGDP